MSDNPKPDHDAEDKPEHEGSRIGLRRRLGRLLDRKELVEDTQSMLGGVLDVSDRAKTELVRLMARELRHYLDEMKVKEEVMELITSHSLEVKLSLHLKPLVDAVTDDKPVRRRRGQSDPVEQAHTPDHEDPPEVEPTVDAPSVQDESDVEHGEEDETPAS
jgi:hypothetical protein